jgi:predicted phage terminase large subunit-like protein
MAEKIILKKILGKGDYRKRYQQVLHAMRTEAQAFPDDPQAQKERIARGREDHFYFFKTYLPHYFSAPEAEFHHEIVDLLAVRPDPSANEVLTPVAIAAPREFAKSTVTSFGFAIHEICYHLREFIILGSDTEDLAEDLANYILLELRNNSRLKQDFGDLVGDSEAGSDFVTRNNVRVLARGRGQRIRGLKHAQHRPDLVILDDIENDQNVKNPRIVKDLLRWIKEAVYPGVSSTGNLFIIGTILGRRSALATVIKGEEEPYGEWARRVYRAEQEDGTSLWPAHWPIEKLRQQKKMMGTLAWNKEKQNNPIDEDSPFQEAWIHYYHPNEIKGRVLVTAAGLDPSSTKLGDDKGLVTVGLDREHMIYYVLDAYMRKLSPAGMMSAAYERNREFHLSRLGIEDNAVKDFLQPVIDAAAKEKGFYLPVQKISHASNKEARIVGTLSHLVEQGKILFCKGQSDQDRLVEQLLFLDQPTTPDDGADALEIAIAVLKNLGAGMEFRGTDKKRAYTEMRGFFGEPATGRPEYRERPNAY